MTVENKAVIRRIVDEVLTGGNLDLVDELFAPEYVPHDPSNPARPGGIEGAKQFAGMLHTGLSGVRYTVVEMVAEGDKVMYRWTLEGRHTGPFMGIPPTGRSIKISGIDAFRLDKGRIVESWVAADAMGMLQQLGVIPAPGQGNA